MSEHPTPYRADSVGRAACPACGNRVALTPDAGGSRYMRPFSSWNAVSDVTPDHGEPVALWDGEVCVTGVLCDELGVWHLTDRAIPEFVPTRWVPVSAASR